jgi:thiamine biosynthesis lipoprotein
VIVERREAVREFHCMGGQCVVHVGGSGAGGTTPTLATMLAEARLRALHRRLSRFEPDSELSQLNDDPEQTVFAGSLLRRLAHAVVEAGALSHGLVDATRLTELEQAGYASSRVGLSGLSLAELIAGAPAPKPAEAHPDRLWRAIAIDDAAGTITRPPGVRIDSGGLGKGLAADVVGATLADHATFAVDCGGDVRIGGSARIPRPVFVENPFGGDPLHEFELVHGAAATSGIGRRSWRGRDGATAHHLIDPATGAPAWTGIVQATALAPTALEAEILAKAALLAGPRRGLGLLALGGVLVHADGTTEVVDAAKGLTATQHEAPGTLEA